MQAKTARHEKTAKPRRKLTRAERKQIEAVIREVIQTPDKSLWDEMLALPGQAGPGD